MRITADTNVLVRAVVGDDLAQAQAAVAALRTAEQIAVALPALMTGRPWRYSSSGGLRPYL